MRSETVEKPLYLEVLPVAVPLSADWSSWQLRREHAVTPGS
jgi:hypothetical protein